MIDSLGKCSLNCLDHLRRQESPQRITWAPYQMPFSGTVVCIYEKVRHMCTSPFQLCQMSRLAHQKPNILSETTQPERCNDCRTRRQLWCLRRVSTYRLDADSCAMPSTFLNLARNVERSKRQQLVLALYLRLTVQTTNALQCSVNRSFKSTSSQFLYYLLT